MQIFLTILLKNKKSDFLFAYVKKKQYFCARKSFEDKY